METFEDDGLVTWCRQKIKALQAELDALGSNRQHVHAANELRRQIAILRIKKAELISAGPVVNYYGAF